MLESLSKPMPIGRALSSGWDTDRRAVWELNLDGEDVPGRWIVVDREFRLIVPPDDIGD